MLVVDHLNSNNRSFLAAADLPNEKPLLARRDVISSAPQITESDLGGPEPETMIHDPTRLLCLVLGLHRLGLGGVNGFRLRSWGLHLLRNEPMRYNRIPRR